MVGLSRREGTLIVVFLNIFSRSGLNWFCWESSPRFLEEDMYRRDGKKFCFLFSLENNKLHNFC